MKKTTPIFLTIIAIIFVSILYLLYLNINKPPVTVSTSTPTTGIITTDTVSPTTIPTVNPTADWQTYTNNDFEFSFKYPSSWVDETDKSLELGKEFRLKTNRDEFINGVVFDHPADNLSNQTWSKEINLKNNKSILITYTDNLGPGSKGGTIDIDTFHQILSTFKFTNTPTPTIQSLKTYENSTAGISFKYPSNFNYSEKADPYYLISSQPFIKIYIYTEGNSMYNECMNLTKTETSSNLMIKRYSAVNTGEACPDTDQTRREIWVTKNGGSGYGPGIIFSYSSAQATESEKIFSQILSTFKFLN